MNNSIFDIPVPKVLEALGKGTPDIPAFRPYLRKGIYLSPFVTEKTPSFHWINNQGQNCWHCFSTGKGGGILALVMLVKNCDKKEAIHFLENIDSITPGLQSWTPPTIEENGEIIIEDIGPIRRKELLEYSSSRKISRALTKTYFAQIRYHYSNRPKKSYTSLAFPNIKNGFTLCNRTRNGKIKICTSCAPTFINRFGQFSFVPTSPTVLVTEGVWDALSLITINRDLYGNAPGADLVVLNSTTMTMEGGAADKYIRKHSQVFLYLDHDPVSRTGQKKTQELIQRYQAVGIQASDASYFYADSKDLNDFLLKSSSD